MIKKLLMIGTVVVLMIGCASTNGFLGLATVSYMETEMASMETEMTASSLAAVKG